jgi:hypothetical protein
MKQIHYNELMKLAADLETEGDGDIAKSLRYAIANPSFNGAELQSDRDSWRALAESAKRDLAALATPQADAAPSFEAWATKEGLISESHGVRFVNSMCDVARKAWDAAIAAGGAQEPIYQVIVGEKWVDSTAAEYAAVSNEKRIVNAAPLPREAATVALTDVQIASIYHETIRTKRCDGQIFYHAFARALLAASNGEKK